MNAGVPASGQSVTPSPPEIREQIDRIAASPGFRKSPPIRFVLLYLADRAVDCPGHSIKEHEIATAALGRSPDFDPKADSSVRVIMTRLRSRLAEYYTHEGSTDPIFAEIPRGSYLLAFHFRMGGSNAAEALILHPQEAVIRSEVTPRRASGRSVLAGSVLLLTAMLLAFAIGRRSAQTRTPPELTTFWKDFLQFGDPLVVFSNPIFQGTPELGMHLLDPSASRSDGTNETFTGAGEVMAVHDLTATLATLGHQLSVKRARLFTWDEATANNLIIVGGPAQSVVFLQLPQLENLALKAPDQPPFFGQEAVHSLKADPTRPDAFYLPSRHGDSTIEYAIVDLTPGASADRSTLITAGTNSFATEAAVRFVCERRLLRSLLDRLHVRSGQPVPHFEALLKVEIRGGAPLDPQLLTVFKRS